MESATNLLFFARHPIARLVLVGTLCGTTYIKYVKYIDKQDNLQETISMKWDILDYGASECKGPKECIYN